MEFIFSLAIILSVAGGAGTLVLRNLYYICQPSEVLIFAGSDRQLEDGRRVGYRLVKGGSSIRTPLLERAFRMDLSNMIIELKVTGAYSKGGIPLTVEGVANIKVAGSEPTIHNAIERLLGKSRKEIETLARETLEGNLRGVLASLTPQQINEDKMAFAKSLLDEAEDDLEKLGLVLDNLQIQNISDDVRYLDSIGRKQQAELQRDARIAEAEAKATSAIRNAENERITALKRIERDIEIAKAEAERRVKNALTQRVAVVAEAEAEIAAEVARRQAEVSVQTERIKQVEQQLQADVVAPAEAECKRAIARAKGNAARIIEDGKAQAEGSKRLVESWQAAGPAAREIFLFQKLETLLKTMVATVPEVDVRNVTVIDGNNGNSASKIASFMEQMRQTTGLDIVDAVRSFSGQQPVKDARVLPKATAKPQTNNFSSDAPSLAIASKEVASTNVDVNAYNALRSDVQQILERLADKNPSNVQAERAIETVIKENSSLKKRLKRTLEVGGSEVLKEIFDHPTIRIPAGMIKVWVEQD
jgi:flotillin